MRKLAVLAAATILFGFIYVIRDVGHVPLFDANIQRLAETVQEGYCAGVTFWTHGGEPNPTTAQECRDTSQRPTDYNLAGVQDAFCYGVVDTGYGGGQELCLTILQNNRYWPTYDGGLTNAWNKAYPYPGDRILVTQPDDSRTGDRSGFTREGP
jgi:hypothetical protein